MLSVSRFLVVFSVFHSFSIIIFNNKQVQHEKSATWKEKSVLREKSATWK